MDNTLETLLNKEEFVEFLKSLNAPEEEIEKHWEKIQASFSLLFFQDVYDNMNEDAKQEVTNQAKQATTSENSSTVALVQQIQKFVENNPTALDYKSMAKKAATQTKDKYLSYLEGTE